MNESENKFGGSSGDMQNELSSLRLLISVALVLVIVFTASVDYYLSAQTSEVNRVVALDQQELEGYPAFASKAAEFWNKLVEYSKAHPDINPIIDKWKANVGISGAPPAKKK